MVTWQYVRFPTGLELQIGTDLEKIEARTETFVLDYFTCGERRLVDQFPAESRAAIVTLDLEREENSMLKALGVGLRQDTRSVEVLGLDAPARRRGHGEWQRIQIGEQPASQRAWAAWWQRRNAYILTLAGIRGHTGRNPIGPVGGDAG